MALESVLNGTLALGFILLVVLFFVIGPLLTLWMLNTLFHLGIAYTIKTWVAALILNGSVITKVEATKT